MTIRLLTDEHKGDNVKIMWRIWNKVDKWIEGDIMGDLGIVVRD
jgi:hypothetical protein